MKRGELVSGWVASPGKHDMYPATAYAGAFSDATGQPDANIPTAPNLLVIAFEVEDAVLIAMASDPEIDIIWSEDVVSDG